MKEKEVKQKENIRGGSKTRGLVCWPVHVH
jgi:hypothetical protein